MNSTEFKIKKIITPKNAKEIQEAVSFLHKHLDQYRDKPEEIESAVRYALSDKEKKPSGYILKAIDKEKTIGYVVMNETGMKGYVPSHFLVYIAVHEDFRGQGIGKKLLERAKKESPGNISLHVEYDNPAKKLYEAVGFSSKYAEMRLIRD